MLRHLKLCRRSLSQFHGGSAWRLDMKLRTLHRLYGYTPAISYFHI